MEESDDGGLEAVVRGGRGYNSIRMYNNNPYGWQLPPAQGMDAGSIENAGIEEGLATVSISMTQMSQADSNSQMNMFANLLTTSTACTRPPATDLQEVCSPFFNGSLLRSGSSSSKLLFENMEVQVTSPIFAADSPTASMFSSVEKKPGDPIKVEPETEFGKLSALKSVDVVSPARLSSLAPEPDVTISKPLKVESCATTKEGDGSSLSIQARTDSAIENGSSSQTTGSAKGQGSKRRKTQQKRIVCVPAAGGSNRPSGEGLPSDLWAWRKYGQKPIKGSPYPRGYYRCSSSKGCSARKQVERSRTDPNMLVITYTSDHNHPWPTHRNALAGSTRQVEKVNSCEKENSDQLRPENSCVPAEINSTPFSAVIDSSEATASEGLQQVGAAGSNSSVQPPDSAIQQNDPAAINNILTNAHHHDEDFFAELGELPESLNIFPRHFHDDKSDDEAASSVLDPFNLFNWSSTTFPDTKTAPLPQF